MRRRDSESTRSTRAIALLVHALRQSRHRTTRGHTSWFELEPDAEARLLRHTRSFERRALPWFRIPLVRRLFLQAAELCVPGTGAHLLARKLWFHTKALEFLSAHPNSPQAVILGAGLDPSGLRLVRGCDAAAVLEIDRPATMACKRDATEGVPGLGFFGADLTEPGSLDALPLTRDRPTVLLAEGLFMYLREDAVRRILTDCLHRFRGPLRLGFSYLDPDRLSDPRSSVARIARALARGRTPERFHWSIRPTELPEWLEQAGFTLTSTGPPDPGQSAYGEWTALAERRSPETISATAPQIVFFEPGYPDGIARRHYDDPR